MRAQPTPARSSASPTSSWATPQLSRAFEHAAKEVLSSSTRSSRFPPFLLHLADAPLHSGISRAYGGSLSALEIFVTLSPQFDISDESWRDKPSLWSQSEEVSALYLDKRGKERLSSKDRVVELPRQ